MISNGEIRDRIRNLARKKGMSLPELEQALGFGSGTIVKWDKSNPGIDKLFLVSDFLEVSLDYIVRGHDFIPNGSATENEYDLIEYFRQLNDAGREALLDYMRYLIGQKKYIYMPAASDHKA